MTRKSYWQSMVCKTERDHEIIRRWFAPLCDDMMPTKAQVLCDVATGREKKLRVFFTDKAGAQKVATRTIGHQFTITIKAVENKATAP